MSEVALFFGRALNEHFTTGDGSSKPEGLFNIPKVTGTNQVLFTKDVISDTDFEQKAYEALGMLDRAHATLPSVRWMMNNETIVNLLAARTTNGQKIWNVSQDARTLLFAGGIPVEPNNDINVVGDGAAQVIAVVGPLEEYHTLSVGGMRSDVDRVQLSDQYTLAWFDMWGGLPFWKAAADKSFIFMTEGP